MNEELEPHSVTITIENPIECECSKCGKKLRRFDSKIGTYNVGYNMKFERVTKPFNEKWFCEQCGI